MVSSAADMRPVMSRPSLARNIAWNTVTWPFSRNWSTSRIRSASSTQMLHASATEERPSTSSGW